MTNKLKENYEKITGINFTIMYLSIYNGKAL